ncbi:hypothetical protein KR52_13385 [Synechococcus sp. KORDI-52]|uniref:carotenoid oxygenase family protein n=1 Tax=Synechococcus sp. KORDI-52 TaxID=585425 RepID=UPI0004E04D43|nr:carotenoid oxygenase family protein [Synechococcus sp. KORDI-52]AII50119.1 hypothetical protein KR52_13385 [Synechococcus sp. KORDI-52]
MVESAVDLSQGVFRPVSEEISTGPLDCSGSIPTDLNGRWLRNGPNPHNGSFIGNDTFSWFLGDGMVHGIHLENGQALSYTNRWVKTATLARAQGQDVETDTPANTNIIRLGDQLLALCEGGVPHQMTNDLTTVGPQDFGGALPGGHMTAHPKFDAATGETIAFDYDWKQPFGRYFIFNSAGTITHSSEIPLDGPSMMHDFAVTASRSIFLDLPVVFDLKMAMHGRAMPYRWTPDYKARLGVLPRYEDGAAIRWFEIEPCFIFHTMNAYDDGDSVVLDAVRYERLLRFDFDSDAFIPDDSPGILTRFELNLATGQVRESVLCDANVEFPRVGEALVGQPYRAGYAVEFAPNLMDTLGLIRFDTDSGNVTRWQHQPGDAVGEPLFVPRQGAEPLTATDGYLLYPLYRGNEDRSALQIRDAGNLAGGVLASIELPTRIPAGFHGNWISAS